MPFATRTPTLTIRDVTVLPPNQGALRPRDEVVTQLADGRIVIVWSGSQYGDNDVRFQILNSAGVPLTPPASVFGVEDATARFVSVTALPDGGFLIRGDNAIQRYDVLGVVQSPTTFLPSGTGGEVSALGTGFVAATIVDTQSVVLAFYDANNALISQATIGRASPNPFAFPGFDRALFDPQIAVRQGADNASTRIVLVWTEEQPFPSTASIYGGVRVQITNGAGQPIGAMLSLEADPFNGQPDVTFLNNGSFVVTWGGGNTFPRPNGGEPGSFATSTQVFSADGTALGPRSQTSRDFGSNASNPSVTALADGGFLLTWTGSGVGRAQQFDAAGVRVGGELTFALREITGAVALADGSVFVVGGLQYQLLSPGITTTTGTDAADTFSGPSGDDSYNGGGGADLIRGGSGNDILRGGVGDDFIYGDAGNDVLQGGTGFDTIDGGDGIDVLLLDKPIGSYFFEPTAEGFRLWDGAEYDTVTNVEGVYALDRRVYSLADLQKLSFNALAYIASYTDLANGFGANALAGYRHYIDHGIGEGRFVGFDPISYLAANYDLAAGYGYDPVTAARHYIEHGRLEGRQTAGFNALLYGASNPDLARIFGGSVEGLTLHFLEFGAREGRSLASFNALIYAASNVDVARVYRTDVAALIDHYLAVGADEGRTTNAFDPLAYAATHVDLARFFGADASGAVQHYINHGIGEGRAAAGFDSVAYLLSNPDLAGIGARGALLHWLNSGADEARVGDSIFGREQAGAHALSGTTQASLERAGDHDWFEVSLVGGIESSIRVSGASSGGGTLTDGWLRLYNEAGVLVATNRGPVGTSDAEILFRPTTSGRYFLVVAGETDRETGTYRVTVAAAQPAAPLSSHGEDGMVSAAYLFPDAFDRSGDDQELTPTSQRTDDGMIAWGAFGPDVPIQPSPGDWLF